MCLLIIKFGSNVNSQCTTAVIILQHSNEITAFWNLILVPLMETKSHLSSSGVRVKIFTETLKWKLDYLSICLYSYATNFLWGWGNGLSLSLFLKNNNPIKQPVVPKQVKFFLIICLVIIFSKCKGSILVLILLQTNNPQSLSCLFLANRPLQDEVFWLVFLIIRWPRKLWLIVGVGQGRFWSNSVS